MVDVRGFLPADLVGFTPRPEQAMQLVQLPDWQNWGDRIADAGPAWTITIADAPVVLAGAIVTEPGLAYLWSLIGNNLPARAWPAIYAAIAGRLPQIAALGCYFAHADAADGFPAAHQFIRRLGFTPTGVRVFSGHARYQRALA